MFTMFQIAAGGYGGLVVQTFAVLGGVVLLGWLLTRFVAPRLKRMGPQSRMKVLERMVLEPRKSVYLVEVEGKRLLLGVADNSVSLLERLEGESPDVSPEEPGEDAHGR